MPLNIKNAEVERLAAEVATLARESKTEAIRRALQERIVRLKLHSGRAGGDERIHSILARFRKDFPNGDFGRKMTKRQKEEILGYGPGGV